MEASLTISLISPQQRNCHLTKQRDHNLFKSPPALTECFSSGLLKRSYSYIYKHSRSHNTYWVWENVTWLDVLVRFVPLRLNQTSSVRSPNVCFLPPRHCIRTHRASEVSHSIKTITRLLCNLGKLVSRKYFHGPNYCSVRRFVSSVKMLLTV